MSVSVVINNYNYARYLGEAIESALDQSLPALEVIVVDDGSTDGSKHVIDSFGSRIQAIYQQNGGQASAFNTGILAAHGDWIWLLDSDDSLKPNAIFQASKLTATGISRIAMGMEQIDATGRPIGLQLPNGGREFEGSLRDCVLEEGGLPSTPTSGNIFSKQALLNLFPVPVQDYRICADAYLFVMSAKFGRLKISPAVVANYRIHGSNNFFRNDSSTPEPKALLQELNNVMLTLNLLEDYGRTLSDSDRRKIRQFWMGDQMLLSLLQAKLAKVPHNALDHWTTRRLLTGFIHNFFCGPQPVTTRYHKSRQAITRVIKSMM